MYSNINTVNRLLKKSPVDARQGGKRRKSAVYMRVNEHFEPFSNAAWRRPRVFQQPVNRIARLALSLDLIFIVLSLSGPLGALAYLPFVSIYTGITAFIGWDPAIALMNRVLGAEVAAVNRSYDGAVAH